MKDEATAVYRFFDTDGNLLYVGLTKQPKARFAAHRTDRSWWAAVADIQLRWFGSRREAADAEARAIRDEHPRHNKAIPTTDVGRWVGTGRPVFVPNAKQEAAIQSLIESRRRAAELKDQLWQAIVRAFEAGAPITYMAECQNVFSRSTIHRRLRERGR